jgi:membrane fusion protein (multidrug efflux system)
MSGIAGAALRRRSLVNSEFRSRRWVALARLATAALLPALLFAGCTKKSDKNVGGPAPKVLYSPVIQKDVPIYFEAIGQTRGSVEVEIRARVEGYLTQMNFREGGWVEKGQMLYTIDPLPFEAALARAKGDLAAARADTGKTSRDLARMKPLFEQDAVSRQELDDAMAADEAARAKFEAARATTREAELNLSYCHIQAPLSGVIGISQVSIGNLVGRGQSTLLTSVSAVDPIWVRFSVPERDYLYYAKKIEEKGIKVGAQRNNFQIVLADGSTYDQPGNLRATERVVDPATGSLSLEAEFPNPKRLLLPGQFARVRALIERRPGALLVPQRAVTELQGTFFVSVVKDDGTADQLPVTPSQRVGTYWVVDGALKPGDKVIAEGQMRVRPGMKVTAEPVPAGTDSLPADIAS